MRTTDGQVEALGFGSASTLLRVDIAHQAALVVPIVVVCLVVLVQVVLLVGIFGLIPALAHLVSSIRAGQRWTRTAGDGLVVLAFSGVAWFALTYHLLGLSVSY